MISVLKNQQEYVYSFIEWYVLNDNGQFQEDGEYLYIHDLWIHPHKRKGKSLKHLIQKIHTHPLSYTAKWVYWNNQKHDKLTKPFRRDRLSKIGA